MLSYPAVSIDSALAARQGHHLPASRSGITLSMLSKVAKAGIDYKGEGEPSSYQLITYLISYIRPLSIKLFMIMKAGKTTE